MLHQWKRVHPGMGRRFCETMSAKGGICHDLGQDRYEMGIELASGCHPKNSEGDVSAYVETMDMGDFYGVEGVGDRENPGSKRDESCPDAIGIARSVPSFVVVGYEDGSLSEKEERFKKQGAEPRMILHGDIGFWIKPVHPDGQVVRKHQKSDIVEEAREFQIVQLARSQADRLANQQRDRSRAAAMASLPGERAIDFPADLAHKNAFDVTARCERESEAIDLPEHSLDRDDLRVNLFRAKWVHRDFSGKKQSPRSRNVVLGSGFKTSGRSLCQASGRVSSFFFPVLSCHQRLIQDPHLIQWNCHHNKKSDRHEGIAGQHG